MRITVVALLCLIAGMVNVVRAETIGIEVNVNAQEVEANLDLRQRIRGTFVHTGAGVLYNEDDDFIIGNAKLALSDDIFTPALSLGIGFKGVGGRIEIEKKDFDIVALPFLIFAELDLRKHQGHLPIGINMSFCIAPDPTSFDDTKRYSDFSAAVYVYIIKNAGIGVGYRNINIKLVDDLGTKQKLTEDKAFFGFRLAF